MKYQFSDADKSTLRSLNLPFDPLKELTDKEELQLLDLLMDNFGCTSDEAYEDVYTHLADQVQRIGTV